MSEFAPKTDDTMRLAFVLAIPRPESGDVWDAWITQHDSEVRKAALNAAADAVPPSTMPLGGELAISEPVRVRFQQWLRAQAGGAG